MKFWITLFSLAVFAGGTSLGVALDRNVLATATPENFEIRGRRPGIFSPTRFVRELDLTEGQDAELDDILGDTQRDVEAYGRAIRSAHERSRERIHEILTEGQKARLDELVNEERRRRSEREVEKATRIYTSLLELDEAQAEEVRLAVSETRRQRHEFFRKLRHSGGWHQIRSTFRNLREEQNRRVQAVLRPEQFTRYMEIQSLMER